MQSVYMNIQSDPFYYYSYEFDVGQLPVKCHFLQFLYINGYKENQAALIETEKPLDHRIYGGCVNQLVMFPKAGHKFEAVPIDDFFPVFVFVADERIKGDCFSLPHGYTGVADWGGYAFHLIMLSKCK